MVKLFRVAIFVVGVLPEALGRAIFDLIGTAVGLSNIKGVRQLRTNYHRIVPLSGWAARRRSARAMRSYFRYYYEAFRLPALTPAQISSRVKLVNGEKLQELIATGGSASGALMHMGNWDLAGAWAGEFLAPVHTIAEKLEPPELAELFLGFRRDLGMTIYHAVRGGGAIRNLTADMAQETCFVPLLCDRDLSATGVEVKLCGHPVRVAVGAALLAQRTGQPMFPVTIVTSNFKDDAARVRAAGTNWGIDLIVGDPIWAHPAQTTAEREADLVRMNQEWLDQVSELLPQYLEDWHMLQKVFVADLDQERLAKSRQKVVDREEQ
ncbi:MAG: phosphatidylinositol mannoside acyltransferase [Trueperella sp.]|nr:phosphatidylinositol mannoside acyltransferase [Trueperella sp.]